MIVSRVFVELENVHRLGEFLGHKLPPSLQVEEYAVVVRTQVVAHNALFQESQSLLLARRACVIDAKKMTADRRRDARMLKDALLSRVFRSRYHCASGNVRRYQDRRHPNPQPVKLERQPGYSGRRFGRLEAVFWTAWWNHMIVETAVPVVND